MSVEPAIESGMEDLKVSTKTDINILLIGETGVGKSTLINALANYITYKDFNIAKKEELLVLIPSEFIATDKNGEFHVVKVGEKANNESLSSKQFIKTYVFPIWNGKCKLRLIDTPGMGSINGIDQDNVNTESILRYIGQLNVLHAIFFVLKPNQANSAKIFRQSMICILSQLDKSAGKNIIFVFTNTRGTEYGPGDMINLLKNEIDEFNSSQPQPVIPMNRNIFCFDNEPFRFLAGIKNNIQFDEVIEERNRENWKNSSEQCWKLISYIVGDSKNQPHHIKSSSAINEARRMINQLTHPLVDIYQLISDNINSLGRHEACIRLDNQSLEQLASKMYIPIISMNITELKHPVTICTSRSCAELYLVYGNNKWVYKPCQPSSLTTVPKEMIGIPVSALDPATESSNCPKCGCDFGIHMHVYYLIKAKEEEETDKRNSSSSEEVVENMKQILKIINEKKDELEKELQFIITTCSKFSFFLQNNSISSFNDSLKEYIEYLINREKALGKICDQQTINCLEKFLKEYEDIKSTLENVHRLNKKIDISELSITPKDISEFIQKLYKLKHSGKTLKQLYNCQKKARNHEYTNSEYVKKIEYKSDEKQGSRTKQVNKKFDGKHEKNKKEEVNDKKVTKNTTDKNDNKKERGPKSQEGKGNCKEKGNEEEKNNTKEIKNMKKEKDTKVVSKSNKKEYSTDKGDLVGKEQGNKANKKKEKNQDMKGREKNIDAKSAGKVRPNDKKEKDRNVSEKRNEQVRVNRSRPPNEGATSRNTFQTLDREAPPSYQEIYQRDSQLPNTGLDGAQSLQGYHPQSLGHPNYGVEAHRRAHEPLPAQSAPRGLPQIGNPYGPAYPAGPYSPPPHVHPYGPTPVGDPYRYGMDYRPSIVPPPEDHPTYNINIKLGKKADVPQPRPLFDPYLSTPYHPSQGSHGVHGAPPAPYHYNNPPFDPHSSSGQQHFPKREPPSTSSRGNARGRGGNRGRGSNRGKVESRGKGKGRGGSNRKSNEKKSSKNSEGKGSDSDSSDSDEYVMVD
ncbi:uncharacterized protein [Leptinotarsa decemlineata]|uniref:uncharacterized protein n=1 Tax=Leptinotarsa decemlineata TaxID=7539 RepID=UPI003D30698A